jgi:hypothetical protein
MKLRADLSALPSPTALAARLLLGAAAGITAIWILGAFVDTLHVSMRQGDALREAQRNGSPTIEAARR